MGHETDGPARNLLREAGMPRFAVARALLLVVAAAAGNAAASEPGAMGTPVVGEAQETPHPSVVLTSNLGLAWYRPAVDLEVPLSGHHAIVLDVTWQLASEVRSTIGEAAYRLYPLGGARRLFLGLTAFAGETRVQTLTPTGAAAGEVRGALVGVGLDVGWRWIFADCITIAAGLGAQAQRSTLTDRHLRYDHDETDAPPIFDGTTTGLVPRLRFDVGFAW